MQIQIDISGASVQQLLAAMGARANNLRPAMREIGASIVEDARLRFRDSKDPFGAPWRALSARTIARRRGSPPHKILMDTGRLRNSVAFRPDRFHVEIGTNVRYGRIHNAGGMAGRGRSTAVPARPFLSTAQRGLTREYAQIVQEALVRHMLRGTT